MEAFSQFFSATPSVAAMQLGLLGIACILVFLVLFATRDILLRSDSFVYQLLCVVIVAALPGVGFLLYLLVRPSRTRAQRHMERDVALLLERLHPAHQQKKKTHHVPQASGFTMSKPNSILRAL